MVEKGRKTERERDGEGERGTVLPPQTCFTVGRQSFFDAVCVVDWLVSLAEPRHV